MNYIGHRNNGLAVSLIVSVAYYVFFAANYYSLHGGGVTYSQELIIESLGMFVLTFAGSQIPDLDTSSTPSKIVSIFLTIYWGCVLFIEYYSSQSNISGHIAWQPAAIITFSFLLCFSTKHRSFTHALGWVPVLLVSAYYTNIYCLAIAVGLATHFYCDSISPFRLKNWWFNPFSIKFWT